MRDLGSSSLLCLCPGAAWKRWKSCPVFKVSFDQLCSSRVANSNPSAAVGGFSRTQGMKSQQWFSEGLSGIP